MNQDMSFVKINGQEDTLSRNKYGVTAYPTVVILNSDGSEIDRIVGFAPPVEFINTITMYLDGKETLDDYLKRAEASPDSIELLFKLGEKYEYRDRNDEAQRYYKQVIEKDPNNELGLTGKAIHSMSWISFNDDDIAKAIEWEQQIIDKYPDSEIYADAHTYIPYYYMKWASNLTESGESANAMQYKEQAISLFEDFINKFPDHEDVEWAEEQIVKLKEN